MVGETNLVLFEDCVFSANMSKTHFARSMRTAVVRYDELNPSRLLMHSSSSQHISYLHKTNRLVTDKNLLDN